jgi:hypothetical protein
VQEQLLVTVYDRQLHPVASQPLFTLPCKSFGFSEKFGQLEYGVGVNLKESDQPGTALAHLASAEELKSALLKAYDQFEALARVQIESADGLVVLDHSKMVDQRQTTSIPVPLPQLPTRVESPLPESYRPTAAQKERLLTKLSAEIEAQRQFIHDHAAELHAALEKAFPLAQVLRDLENSKNSP